MEYFDADAILDAQKKKTTHSFTLDELDLPDGMDPPVLVINVSKDIRTRARAAKKRFNNIQGGFQDGESTWRPIDEPEQYLDSVLGFCLSDVEGMFKEGTPAAKKKKAFIALATETEKTAKYIAVLLMDFFDGKTESGDTKN